MILLGLDRESELPLVTQIVRAIVEAVESGRLGPGEALPSTRRLAEQLGISRFTVESAYEELWAEGYTESRPGSCTRIRTRPARSAGGRGEVASAEPEIAARIAPAVGAALAEAGRALGPRRNSPGSEGPAPIDLAHFTLDPRLYPVEAFRRALSSALLHDPSKALVYPARAGNEVLRELIASRMSEHGVATRAADIVLTDGALHALDLVARLLAPPGATVLCEAPTFSGALLLFKTLGLRTIGLACDREGLLPEALEAVLTQEAAASRQPAFLYIIPSLRNPTGSLMGQRRREAILEIATKAGLPLVEDCFEEEVSSFGNPVKPLAAMDSRGLVFYLGTFSKILFPGIRLGWIAARADWAESLALLRAATGVSGNALMQAAVAELLGTGSYEAHVRRMNRKLGRRLAAVLLALREELPAEHASFEAPAGGYLLWLRLAERLGYSAAETEAAVQGACEEEGVLVLPGSPFWPGEAPSPHLRLSIAGLDEEEIAEGIRRLGKAIKRCYSASAFARSSG